MLHKIKSLGSKIRIISLNGKPGAGKGLKGKILTAIGSGHGIITISTSDMIRDNIKKQTTLGIEYEKYQQHMARRGLIPCDLILPGLEKAILSAYEQGSRFIFVDGAPRSMHQVVSFCDNVRNFILCEFSVTDEESTRRVLVRAKYENRIDNGPEVARMGLKTFQRETAPAIRYTKKRHCYIRIDGTMSIRSQVAHILRKLRIPQNEFKSMMSKLDDPTHLARELIDEAERREQEDVNEMRHQMESSYNWRKPNPYAEMRA